MEHSSNALGAHRVEIYPDVAVLAQAAARHFANLATEAIAARGRFAVALAGGTTPKLMYATLASDDFATQVDWSRVHVFWGDERCVASDHPDSNYRMAYEALLDHVPLPAANVHRLRGELEPAQAAIEYEQVLRAFFGKPPERKQRKMVPGGRFDLILLGMGDDGHTASLFPGTAAIGEHERWVVAHYVEKLGVWRVTLTPAVINAAANVIFIVSGAGKSERLRQVLTGPRNPAALPAQIVRPDPGHLLWLVDAAAGSWMGVG
jgi:6-phosphogluconolactonase